MRRRSIGFWSCGFEGHKYLKNKQPFGASVVISLLKISFQFLCRPSGPKTGSDIAKREPCQQIWHMA